MIMTFLTPQQQIVKISPIQSPKTGIKLPPLSTRLGMTIGFEHGWKLGLSNSTPMPRRTIWLIKSNPIGTAQKPTLNRLGKLSRIGFSIRKIFLDMVADC